MRDVPASAFRRMILVWLLCLLPVPGGPLRLSAANPRYVDFRGETVLLMGSSEHYGALVNLDFDYERYLDETRACGLNLVRVFTGTYLETEGAFNIAENTLAPGAGRALVPWARSDVPGAADGGNKFDLTKWDAAWFQRLRSFVKAAGERDIVVEVTLFCPFYNDGLWAASPMNAANHINGVGAGTREECFTLASDLLPYQVAFARRCAGELLGMDNVFLEVMNEPYVAGVPDSWQARIVDELVAAMPSQSTRLLIAQNVANEQAVISDPDPDVSILNFHYAEPEAVLLNSGLGRLIGNDETGFAGETEFPYRKEAWRFMLAGGGLVDHLDFAFTPAREDGLHLPVSPGGGGPSVRRQLGILRWFVEELPFASCEPLDGIVTAGVPSGGGVSVFGVAGEIYGLYLWGGGGDPLTLSLPAGSYTGRWIDTRSGAVLNTLPAISLAEEGETQVTPPSYTDDVALLMFDDTMPLPSVFLDEPSYQTISPQDAPLTLRASVDAAGGIIRTVRFFRNGEPIGETTSEPYELIIAPDVRGPQVFEVRVETQEGAVAMSPPAKVFVAGTYQDGVNLNGPEALTPGQTWKADGDAVAAGMQVTQGTPLAEGEAITLYPKPDASVQSLITSQYLWTQSSSVPQLSVSYPVPDGQYEVFVHIVEAVASHSRDVTVFLEGENVAEGIGDLALGEWVNYGPYHAEVTDGVLDLAFQRTSKGVPKVASFSIYQAAEPVDPSEAKLDVRTDGNTAVLEFPASVALSDIESSDTLEGGWQPVDLPHADHGDSYQIVVPADEPRRFFRLRKVTETTGP